MNIKCFFGFHNPIITERTFMGYSYKFDRHMGQEKFYDFTLKAKCFCCGQKLKGRQRIMYPFAHHQKYDTNPQDWE